MNTNNAYLTEIIFLLDRSGSMQHLERETISGFNSMLERQKAEKGEALVTTVLFDDSYEVLHNRRELHGITPITSREYYTRGSTALLDAIGTSISQTSAQLEAQCPLRRPERVLYIIITDGMENASREYTYNAIKMLVQAQKKKGWEFIFLGANIDAINEAANLGMDRERAARYYCDRAGTMVNFHAINNVITHVRKGMPIHAEWRKNVEKYYADRQKRTIEIKNRMPISRLPVEKNPRIISESVFFNDVESNISKQEK